MLVNYTADIEARYLTTLQGGGGAYKYWLSERPNELHLAILSVQFSVIIAAYYWVITYY